ncbi:hypothetical protein ASPNIDRAFT_39888 [Aspergillus niger ATCC 1015]|uniref:Uncharacterized protein n=1 Tax=Aspergillus niger (strain ATCC 1015 / CBS 113.46 / FGSC A1144 / LSHB Ac4 / NCTC 3858a / NRRL 328 / USDA 3528.7) TaxID=380704 RepID=G3XYX1_ASPNA|nr:hypothetical protein ASPNIDRAFT_39888 [Aspergillus niger ATCC 1015]
MKNLGLWGRRKADLTEVSLLAEIPINLSGWLDPGGGALCSLFLLDGNFAISPDRPRRWSKSARAFRAFRQRFPHISYPPSARFTALWLVPSGVCLGKTAGTGTLLAPYDDDNLGDGG